MKEFYDKNADFHEFLNKYCKKHKISVAEALQHAIVKEVFIDKKERQEGKA